MSLDAVMLDDRVPKILSQARVEAHAQSIEILGIKFCCLHVSDSGCRGASFAAAKGPKLDPAAVGGARAILY